MRNLLSPISPIGPLVFLLAFAAACDRTPDADEPIDLEPIVDFDTAAVRIETDSDTFDLTVEVAEDSEQWTYGLMERPSLPEDAGMIFLYPRLRGPEEGFYMYRTLIPLDIAFIDEEGLIVAVKGMEPCANSNPRVCRTYDPGVSYVSALEVNRYYFERNGIGVGDRVVLLRADDDARADEDGSPAPDG